jgi:hypothetical protein
MQSKSLPPEAFEPILFNGEPLPLGAYWLELLVPILEPLPSGLANWLLDLHYCGGAERSLPSSKVLEHCAYLSERLLERLDEIAKGLEQRIPWAEPDLMIKDWMSTLERVKYLASTHEQSVWTRRSFVNEESASRMLGYLMRYSAE